MQGNVTLLGTRIALLVSLLLPVTRLRADFTGACRDIYQHMVSGRPEPLLEGDFVFLFYPGHVEFGLFDQVYRADGGFRADSSLFINERAARFGTPYFAVFIRATAKELERLREFVVRDKHSSQSCVSGTCRAVNRNLGFYIPPLIRDVPEFTFAYLSVLKHLRLHHGRVGAIEFHGRHKHRAIATTAVKLVVSSAIFGSLPTLLLLHVMGVIP